MTLWQKIVKYSSIFSRIYTNNNAETYIGKRGQIQSLSYYRHTLTTILVSSQSPTLFPAWVHLREYALENEETERDDLNKLTNKTPAQCARLDFLLRYIEIYKVIVSHCLACMLHCAQICNYKVVRFVSYRNVRFTKVIFIIPAFFWSGLHSKSTMSF